MATVLPATAAIIDMVLRVAGMRSPAPQAQEPITLHVVTFVIGLHVLMVCTLAGVGWAHALGPRAPVVLLGVALAAAGNVLPRLRPNLALGIRTARSMDDARLWSHLHRRSTATGTVTGKSIPRSLSRGRTPSTSDTVSPWVEATVLNNVAMHF